MVEERDSQEILVEESLVRELFERLTMIAVLSTLTAVVVCVVIWQQVDTTLWVGWLASVLITNGLRIACAELYKQTHQADSSPEQQPYTRWSRYYLWATILSGLTWGIGGVLLIEKLSFVYQLFILLVLAAIAVGLVVSLMSSLVATRSFLLSLQLPVVLWLFATGEHLYISIGLLAVIYLVLLWLTATSLHQALRESKSLRIANLKLIDELEQEVEIHRKLQDIIENTNDMIYAHDLEGHCTAVNSAVERVLGITKEEVIGADLSKLIATDNDRAKVQDILQQTLAGETGESIYEINVVDANGDLRTLEINFTLILKDEKPFEVQGIARDITERKQAEATNARLADIVENANDIIYSHDLNGIIITINPAGERLFKVPREQIIGNSYEKYVKPEDLTRVHEMMRQKVTGETGSTEYEIGFIDAEGGEHHLQVRSHMIYADGVPVEIQGVVQDITEEKVHEEKMEHVQRLESLGVLAGGIAHDFNNILTTIMGNASLAEQIITENPKVAVEHMQHVLEAADRSAQLCRQMLAYSGKGKYIIKSLDLSSQVKSMGRLLAVSLDKQVELHYELTENLPQIEGDEAQIQQVIMNLITNANEAIAGEDSKHAGEIKLSTGVINVDRDYLNMCLGSDDLETGRYIFMEVSDNGCGMDKAVQKRLFDPFYTTKITGRGLGMSAVLGIIRGHKGAIHLTSKVGKGTLFRVVFPIHDQMLSVSEGGADRSQPDEISAFETSMDKVLVIDDEVEIRELVKLTLAKAEIQVLEASDGFEGVEVYKLHRDHISMVLLDMTIPKMDGAACFLELLKINPDVKVILSSGYAESDALKNFPTENLVGFIQKPYLPNALIEWVQQCSEKEA